MAKTVGVNWSAVAVRAFELKLGQLAEQKREKKVKDVVERLRACKLKSEEQSYQDGFAAGKYWAEHEARPIELERLLICRMQVDDDWDSKWSSDDDDAISGGKRLAKVVVGKEEEFEQTAMDNPWRMMIGDNPNWAELGRDGEFVRGFAEGALSVWIAVKDQI